MSDVLLPVPPHFDPGQVDRVWRVPYQQRAAAAAAWARQHGIRPAANDARRVALLVVDCQNTFCIPGFELFVAGRSGRGAVEDNVRLCEFVYRHLGQLTAIHATLDTHRAIQIFHPVFWVDAAGEHPAGGATIITLDDVQGGIWRVNPAVAASVTGGDVEYLQRHALHYVRRLTEGGKYPLMVWPYHAMLGGIGHALVAAVEEALFFHALARQAQTGFEVKGDNPLTENYSVLQPEVTDTWDGEIIARRNEALIRALLRFDRVVIAGQAKSHCVAWTIQDLLSHLLREAPDLVSKVHLLEDCTSAVVVPGADFTEQADAAFQRFAAAGMRLVRSTQPMAEWEG
jgi:nicotinamidase-related amidase